MARRKSDCAFQRVEMRVNRQENGVWRVCAYLRDEFRRKGFVVLM